MKPIRLLTVIIVLCIVATNAYAYKYTVKRGDSLWKIAKREYGIGERWRTIYRANRKVLGRSPNKIKAGCKIEIPRPGDIAKVPAIPKGYRYWKTIKKVKVTAYCPARCCCGRYADGKTATGTNAWLSNGCAVYKKAIPYGTMLDIPGLGFRKADDTGPAMKRSWWRGRYHVDVRFKYHYSARRWGVKTLDIKLYRKIRGNRK